MRKLLHQKKKAAPAKEDSDSDAEEPVAKKAKTEEKAAEPVLEECKVFIGGIPWSCSKEQLEKDFAECGEVTDCHMPLNEEGKPKGFAFVTFSAKSGVDAALKFDGDDYGGRRLSVKVAEGRAKGDGKGKSDKGKGKGKDGDKGKGKGKERSEFEVSVRGLSFDVTQDTLQKDFAECGEIVRISMPMNDEGTPRGFAFITYKDDESVQKACKFNEDTYAGRTIYVSKAGEGGKGGKDGKGKGKDGKGKGKDSKGKGKGKKGMSDERMAANTGAMVESTGKKQTFESDSEGEAPPPKKAKKAPVADSDSE